MGYIIHKLLKLMIGFGLERCCLGYPIVVSLHNSYPRIRKMVTVLPIFKGRSIRRVMIDGAFAS
jgi:hypothetical protein